jgi:hypothetical protein
MMGRPCCNDTLPYHGAAVDGAAVQEQNQQEYHHWLQRHSLMMIMLLPELFLGSIYTTRLLLDILQATYQMEIARKIHSVFEEFCLLEMMMKYTRLWPPTWSHSSPWSPKTDILLARGVALALNLLAYHAGRTAPPTRPTPSPHTSSRAHPVLNPARPHVSVCVRARVRARACACAPRACTCARVCACACVRVDMCAGVGVGLCICMRVHEYDELCCSHPSNLIFSPFFPAAPPTLSNSYKTI